jgi:hypothetical protein
VLAPGALRGQVRPDVKDGVAYLVILGVVNVVVVFSGQLHPRMHHETPGANAQRLVVLGKGGDGLLTQARIIVILGKKAVWQQPQTGADQNRTKKPVGSINHQKALKKGLSPVY